MIAFRENEPLSYLPFHSAVTTYILHTSTVPASRFVPGSWDAAKVVSRIPKIGTGQDKTDL